MAQSSLGDGGPEARWVSSTSEMLGYGEQSGREHWREALLPLSWIDSGCGCALGGSHSNSLCFAESESSCDGANSRKRTISSEDSSHPGPGSILLSLPRGSGPGSLSTVGKGGACQRLRAV